MIDSVSGDERETGERRRRFRWYERPAGVALAEVQLPIVRVIVCNPDSMHVRFGQEPLTAVSLCASKVETRYFAIHQVHRALVGRLVRGQDAVVGAECIPTAEHNTLSIGRQLGKDSVGRVLNDRRRDGVVPRRWPVRVDDLLAERHEFVHRGIVLPGTSRQRLQRRKRPPMREVVEPSRRRARRTLRRARDDSHVVHAQPPGVPDGLAKLLKSREPTVDALPVDGSSDTASVQVRQHASDVFVLRREDIHCEIEPKSPLSSRDSCDTAAGEPIEPNVLAAGLVEGTAERWRWAVGLHEIHACRSRITVGVVHQAERLWQLLDTIYERKSRTIVRPQEFDAFRRTSQNRISLEEVNCQHHRRSAANRTRRGCSTGRRMGVTTPLWCLPVAAKRPVAALARRRTRLAGRP